MERCVSENRRRCAPAALRAILRQDPDIVMIGEIRDRETAEIAMAAAVTGHLVLSTIQVTHRANPANFAYLSCFLIRLRRIFRVFRRLSPPSGTQSGHSRGHDADSAMGDAEVGRWLDGTPALVLCPGTHIMSWCYLTLGPENRPN